jgi:1,5-anhydro-D-fructose reductase (1,5-anhydro-D-mannitol-forming)
VLNAAGNDPTPRGYLRGRAVVRWGILGCGDVTEIKSGPGFRLAARSQLVAVMRRDGAKAADYARRHGVPRWYDQADALIADPEVDAIYIATPPDSHLSLALKVAAAGKPAYVEKPMARNTAECDAMLEGFQASHLPLFVAYYRRRLPRFLAVKELLSAGRIGQVTGVSYAQAAPYHRNDAGWRTSCGAAGGGHAIDLGSHTLDLIDELFGPISAVHGNAANLVSSYEVEDAMTMTFSAGGIPGAASWNFASGAARDELAVTGTCGRISFPIFENGPVRIETSLGLEILDRPHPPHVQQPLIQSVVDDLLGLGLCPCTGFAARRATRCLDAALSGYYGGRDDAFWLRPQTWPGRPMRPTPQPACTCPPP